MLIQYWYSHAILSTTVYSTGQCVCSESLETTLWTNCQYTPFFCLLEASVTKCVKNLSMKIYLRDNSNVLLTSSIFLNHLETFVNVLSLVTSYTNMIPCSRSKNMVYDGRLTFSKREAPLNSNVIACTRCWPTASVYLCSSVVLCCEGFKSLLPCCIPDVCVCVCVCTYSEYV